MWHTVNFKVKHCWFDFSVPSFRVVILPKFNNPVRHTIYGGSDEFIPFLRESACREMPTDLRRIWTHISNSIFYLYNSYDNLVIQDNCRPGEERVPPGYYCPRHATWAALPRPNLSKCCIQRVEKTITLNHKNTNSFGFWLRKVWNYLAL